LTEEQKELKDYKIEGMRVRHKAFGDGVIAKKVGNYITCVFNGEEKELSTPDAFINGFLVSEYDDFTENEQKRITLAERIKENSKAIEETATELKGLII
jgi:hypothetical protein